MSLQEFSSHELIYGNKFINEPDYVYFVIHGEVRIVRSMLLGVLRQPYGITKYDLVSKLVKKGLGMESLSRQSGNHLYIYFFIYASNCILKTNY